MRLGSRSTFLNSARKGATLAEDDCRVAVEFHVVLDGLGLDPRESPLRLLEDAVQEDGEDDAREGAALRPARSALAHVLEAARRRRVAHVDVARLRAVGVMGPIGYCLLLARCWACLMYGSYLHLFLVPAIGIAVRAGRRPCAVDSAWCKM